jgi:hypothetical protein
LLALAALRLGECGCGDRAGDEDDCDVVFHSVSCSVR